MAAKKKPSALDLCLAELKKNKNVAYANVKAKADKKRIKLYPVTYGRAKAMLGLVKVAKRGTGKAAKKAAKSKRAATKTPGRPKGTAAGGSKSDQIRKLLRSGLSAGEIAKKVRCSVNLVYAVKSASKKTKKRGTGRPKGSKTRRGPGRPRKRASAIGDLRSLISGLQELQR